MQFKRQEIKDAIVELEKYKSEIIKSNADDYIIHELNNSSYALESLDKSFDLMTDEEFNGSQVSEWIISIIKPMLERININNKGNNSNKYSILEEQIQKLQNLLDQKDFSKIISFSNNIKSIAPVFDEDINSIKKTIIDNDFGNCKIFVDSLINKLNSIKNKNITVNDNVINGNDLIDIGGICAAGNEGFTPVNNKEWSLYNFNEGKMYQLLGQLDKAELSYKKSLSNDKANVDSLFKLKKIYIDSQKFDQVLSLLTLHIPFIENGNDKLILKFTKANTERQLGMIPKSIETIDTIINGFDTSSKTDLYYDSILFRGVTKASFDIESAMNDLDSVRNHSPENFYKNADALMIFGAFNNNISVSEKIKYLQKSIEILPNWEFPHYNLAVVLKKEKRYLESLEHYKIAYKLNNNETDYIDGICECLYRLDNRQELTQFLRLGIEMGSDYCNMNSDLL